MIEIMYENIAIAEEKILNGEKVIVLKENVKPAIVPFDLFKNGSHIASGEEFINWLEDRIFQENRTDKEDLLKLLDLKEYTIWGIAKKTTACLMTDPYWVKFSEKDTFRESTIRGRFGFEELEDKDVFLE